MERIIKKRLQQHFGTSDILSPAQHGFRSRRSATSNLLLAIELWISSLDRGAPVDVAYIDFSKAFDKVPHGRLVSKLNAYGVRGKILHWISEFLDKRQLRVKLNNGL